MSLIIFYFSIRIRHTRCLSDWSSDVCSSDLIGSSGMAALFTLSASNPGTAASVGEAIAQRLNTVVRAGEQARECEVQLKKSQFSKALDAARKAMVIEPNLPAAHICIATAYEAQHM